MIFDTDVLIWLQRGNAKAATLVDSTDVRLVSILTQMELMQGARNPREATLFRSFLVDLDFHVLPLTEAIGHRAAVYVEQLALSHGLRANDAIIAATAMEQTETLCTANAKHFRPIQGLDMRVFRP
ncbi:MAG TPA: type II toxin-antitoxin system VapC family toxin [Fibrobacteraceae bacterium]|nr:type II toxin-antitoxin system VapC family toxin [Fibrobacteraceae bacterium]